MDALTASTKQTEARSLEDFFDVLDHMASGKGVRSVTFRHMVTVVESAYSSDRME